MRLAAGRVATFLGRCLHANSHPDSPCTLAYEEAIENAQAGRFDFDAGSSNSTCVQSDLNTARTSGMENSSGTKCVLLDQPLRAQEVTKSETGPESSDCSQVFSESSVDTCLTITASGNTSDRVRSKTWPLINSDTFEIRSLGSGEDSLDDEIEDSEPLAASSPVSSDNTFVECKSAVDEVVQSILIIDRHTNHG